MIETQMKNISDKNIGICAKRVVKASAKILAKSDTALESLAHSFFL